MSLGDVVKIAFDLRADMRANGASGPEIDAATERILRANFPSVREWKYLCCRCFDYGLEMTNCPGDATCGRDQPHGFHEFGTACWCSAGQKFRKKPKAETDFEEAGKVQKARGFSRAGR